MKTFYIPTSSLNFNNILSSESISPKAFYRARAFGYSRWVSIPENPNENSIVLYDQLCSFVRPKSDLEDHPMVVEVILDDILIGTLTRLEEHTFLSDRTIYLDPFTTRIFFFSEKDRRVALSLSDSSIETKLVRLYQKKIQVITPPVVSYHSLGTSNEVQSLNMTEIDREKRINRMKGLLYGYYIGGLLSSSRDDILTLNSLREIQDILAAIVASLDHRATPQQINRLRVLYSGLQPEIPFYTKLSKLIPDRRLFDAVVSLVRDEYGFIHGELDVNRIIARLLSTNSREGRNPEIEYVCDLIRRKEAEMEKMATPVSVADDQIAVADGSFVHINRPEMSNFDRMLYMSWVNDVFTKDEYSGKISTFKEVLSDDITLKAKEISPIEWKGSYPEITLNALRRHIRGDEFGHVWKDDLYSSVAAVIIRGDSWQNLLHYMQDKLMTDYRIAFSLYGALNGFANLPRDFTDVLLSRNSAYVAEVYKEFFGQLFSRSIPTATSKVDSSPEITGPLAFVEDMPDFSDGSLDQDLPHPYEDLWQEARRYVLKNLPSKASEAEKYTSYYIHEIDKVFDTSDDISIILDGIKSIPDLINKSKWKTARSGIIKSIESRIKGERKLKQKVNDSANLLFKSIIDDDDAVIKIKAICKDSNIADLVVANFKELQEGYRPNGFYYKRKDPRSNSDVIDHFSRYCFSERNKKNRIINNKENIALIEAIKMELKNIYID